jgi:hypothetical protein
MSDGRLSTLCSKIIDAQSNLSRVHGMWLTMSKSERRLIISILFAFLGNDRETVCFICWLDLAKSLESALTTQVWCATLIAWETVRPFGRKWMSVIDQTIRSLSLVNLPTISSHKDGARKRYNQQERRSYFKCHPKHDRLGTCQNIFWWITMCFWTFFQSHTISF